MIIISEISKLIFHGANHYITSPYGYRTLNGKTTLHKGCDYGTNSKKLPQYGIADDGVVLSCGADSAQYGGALYAWVSYPSLGVKLLHYHLDSISVKAGQKVTKNTVIGCTGKTGNATGIHLHLGIKRLSGGDYIDPEKWAKEEYPKLTAKQTATAESTPSGSDTVYIAVKDDTLSAIAKKYGTTVQQLARYNGIANPNVISVGQKIKIPTAATAASTTPKYTAGNYRVAANLLHVRSGAGTSCTKKTFSQLTADAQKKIKSLNGGKAADGYVKGVTFTVSQVSGNWGKTPSGWVCLDYCTKI